LTIYTSIRGSSIVNRLKKDIGYPDDGSTIGA
jgi:hypothetical protein